VESGFAVEVADRAGDRGEVRLRNLLGEIRLIDRCDAIGGDGASADDADPAQ